MRFYCACIGFLSNVFSVYVFVLVSVLSTSHHKARRTDVQMSLDILKTVKPHVSAVMLQRLCTIISQRNPTWAFEVQQDDVIAKKEE